ncbi:MAG: hypothetical protein ABI912_10270 [Actinomycetota bacterium]
MNYDELAAFRPLLDSAGIEEDVVNLAATLGSAPHGSGGLLLVGTESDEPWHFAAHLADESRWNARPDLEPTLVRWQIPVGAPPHLAVGLERLEQVRRSETLFVVAPTHASEGLLERVADARRLGALVLSVHGGDRELGGLAHEAVDVPDAGLLSYLEIVQHVVSQSAPGGMARRRSVRARINRLLDTAQGLRAPGAYGDRANRPRW